MKKLLVILMLLLVGCAKDTPTDRLITQRANVIYQMRNKNISNKHDIIWMDAMDKEINKLDSLIVMLNTERKYSDYEMIEE